MAALLAVLGCARLPEEPRKIPVMGRRATTEPWSPVSQLPVLGTSDRIALRVTLPSELPTHPALSFDAPPGAVVRLNVNERPVLADPPGSLFFPLRSGDGGGVVEGWMHRQAWLSPPEAYIASHGSLLWRGLQTDLAPFSIGFTLLLLGMVVTLAGLRAGGAAQRWMGVFATGSGLVLVAQATAFRQLLAFPALAWTLSHTVGLSLFPAALARMIVELYGDTRHRMLHWLSLLTLGWLVVQLVLPATGWIGLIALKRGTYVFMLLLVPFALVVLVPRARRGDTPARIIAAGLVGLLAVGLPAVLSGLGLIPLLDFNPAPYSFLVFVSATGLAVQHWYRQRSVALAASERQLALRVTELEHQRGQIESLNEDLRHQLEQRSRELKESLDAKSVAQRTSALSIGESVDDRYRVAAILGSGAMGIVYEVERLRDGKRFALKAMHGSVTPEASKRFAQEAELAASVRHPNLVGIVDVGISRDGLLYLVMELVRGTTLEGAKEQLRDTRDALLILAQVSRGLCALHQRGVVHRDIKPSNVLLSRDDEAGWQAQVADLGVARRHDFALELAATLAPGSPAGVVPSPSLTHADVLIGTPLYMAPEHALGSHAVGTAVDVFALGIVACELLMGRYPFSVAPILASTSGQKLPEPSLDGVPPGLTDILRRSLSPSPADRPTAEQLTVAFEANS